jgi:hypothetical protein
MTFSTARRLSVAGGLVCVFLLTAGKAGAADKKEVVKQARSAYYSLQSQGLVEFQCNMAPDWEALLQGARQADPGRAEQAIATLKQLQFTVSLGRSGSAKITHTTVTAANDQMAQGLNQIYTGMEQMVTGFFQTWSPFMLGSPLPEAEGDFQMEEKAGQWNLTYKDGTANVVTTMGKNFAIQELKVITDEFTSTIQPGFTSTPKGFLLTGYQADYHGKSPSDTTQLKVGIAYQDVNGLQLPKKLDLSGSYGGSPFQMEITFSGCQATKQ